MATAKKLSVTLEKIQLRSSLAWFCTVQALGFGDDSKIYRTEASQATDAPIFATNKFDLNVATDKPGKIQIQLCEAKPGDAKVASEVGTVDLEFTPLLARLQKGEVVETVTFSAVGGGEGPGKLDVKLRMFDDDDEGGSLITPPATPPPLPDDFGESLMQAGDVEVRRSQADPFVPAPPPAAVKAKPPRPRPPSGPTKTRTVSVQLLRGYNLPLLDPNDDEEREGDEEDEDAEERLPKPPSAFVKMRSGDQVGMTRVSEETRHPVWDQTVVLDARAPVDKGDVAWMDMWVGEKQHTLAQGRLIWSAVPLDQCFIMTIPIGPDGVKVLAGVTPELSLSEQLEHFRDSSKHVLLQCQLDNNPFGRTGIVAVVRLVEGEAAPAAAGDDESELEIVELGNPEDGLEECLEPLKEATAAWAEAMDEGAPQRRYLLLPDPETGAPPGVRLPAITHFAPEGLKEKFVAIELFRPIDPEIEPEDETEPDVDDIGMQFLGSVALSLETLMAAQTLPIGCQQLALSTTIALSEDEDYGKKKPGKLAVTLRLWSNSVMRSRLEAAVSDEGKKKMSLVKYMQEMPDLLDAEDRREEKEMKIRRPFISAPVTPVLDIVQPSPRPRSQRVQKSEFIVVPETKKRPNTSEIRKMIQAAVKEASAKFDTERAELVETLKLLRRDVSTKNQLLTRNQKDLDARNEALRKCGVEIMELRQHNKQVLIDKENLQKEILQRDALQEEAASGDLEALDRTELEQRLHLLAQSYKQEQARYSALLERMQGMHKELLSMQGLRDKYKTLQEAHMAQASHIQSMQGQLGKMEQYVATTKNQEKVIEKLEDLMEASLIDARKGRGVADAEELRAEIDRFKAENASLRSQLESDIAERLQQVERERREEREMLQAQIEELKKRGGANPEDVKKMEQELEELRRKSAEAEAQLKAIKDREEGAKKAPAKEPPPNWEVEKLRLTMRADKAETRIKMVEKQMTTNTQKF
eukprot:CAMPEP_0114539082 /NCGR_PEP_ID=MMETSP0114-20121206/49_1 /TAXON_ID=31324 /ORGANISM="Goniomonas sp, Strain m" /LENGTH=979 /DNA_ID=CAMNT_0001723163 /DNA_START=50 /DNA_END=2986 /DNA_ORIENTATION=-